MEDLPAQISEAGNMLAKAILDDRKILTIGNGVGGILGNLFCLSLVSSNDRERPALPVISLCNNAPLVGSIANRFSGAEIFSRQLHALGSSGDCLVVICADETDRNINAAIQAAHDRQMHVIALTYEQNISFLPILSNSDFVITIESSDTIQTSQMLLLILNGISRHIDTQLFGYHE